MEEWLDTLSGRPASTSSGWRSRQSSPHAGVEAPGRRNFFESCDSIDSVAWRIPFFFSTDRRIVLLTVFRKQRMNERTEISRAHAAMARCIAEGHTAEED